LGLTWPKAMSRARPVEEMLVFLLTSSPVDLQHLEDPACQAPWPRTSLSSLEQITYRIASGGSREVTVEDDDCNLTRYDTIYIPLQLSPKTVSTESH
jgi:hypothetical protein